MLFEVESILINERVLKRTIDLNLFCVKRKLTVLISFFFSLCFYTRNVVCITLRKPWFTIRTESKMFGAR